MLVKVNSVLVPGVNADHLPAVAKRAKELGAFIVNILPLIPVPGTKFENLPAPTAKQRKELQDLCEVDIRQMRHCRQCRADAIGLLGEDRSAEFSHYTCSRVARREKAPVAMELEGNTRYRIAVATSDGKTVDQHFGHAEVFRTYVVEAGKVTEEKSIDVREQQEIPLFGPGPPHQDREHGGEAEGRRRGDLDEVRRRRPSRCSGRTASYRSRTRATSRPCSAGPQIQFTRNALRPSSEPDEGRRATRKMP